MNFQENRSNLAYSPFNPPPSFQTVYPKPNPQPSPQNQQYYNNRQQTPRMHASKGSFNLKEESIQIKQFYRPQQVPINAPLTFNLHSPVRAKTKKTTNRPITKVTKSFIHPFTQQLQEEYFKNQQRSNEHLQDFSKSTSTVMGQSLLNLQQINTEPSPQKQYTPLKSYQENDHNRSLPNTQSLQSFFKKNESYSNAINYNSSSVLQLPTQVSSARERQNTLMKDQKFLLQEIKTQRQTIENFQNEIVKLNNEVRYLKSGGGDSKKQEKDLKNSRKQIKIEKKQLQLQIQQNEKLLAQIQTMENEIKGKQELNKYLEHQCNLYLEEQNRIKQEFETYRNQYVELSQKQDQTINILKKEVSERQSDANSIKSNEKVLRDEVLQLKKTIQLQSQKIEQQSTNNDIHCSQINVYTTKLETLQGKYEKLMHNLCEKEIKMHNYEQLIETERLERKNQFNQLMSESKNLSEKQQRLSRRNQELELQISETRQECSRISNDSSQVKSRLLQKSTYYQSQYETKSELINEITEKLQEKTKELEEMRMNAQSTSKDLESSRSQIRNLQMNQQILQQKITKSECTVQQLSKTLKKLQTIQLQNKALKAQVFKLNIVIEQKNKIVNNYNQQFELLKQSSNQIQSQYGEINKRYEALESNHTAQGVRYKQLEAHLIQNQFDYKILQKEFNEYIFKYKQSLQQNEDFKRANKDLEALNGELAGRSNEYYTSTLQLQEKQEFLQKKCFDLQKFIEQQSSSNLKKLTQLEKQKCELEGLLESNKKMYENKCITLQRDSKQFLVNVNLKKTEELERISIEHETKLEKIQSLYDRARLQLSNGEERLANMSETGNERLLKMTEIYEEEKNAKLLLSTELEQVTKELQAKDQSNVQLIDELQSLKVTFKKSSEQFSKIQQKSNKHSFNQQSLRQEISSLMLIIQQNEERHKVEKKQLLQTIEDQKIELAEFNASLQVEVEESRRVIDELKQQIISLYQREQEMKSTLLQKQNSISQEQQGNLVQRYEDTNDKRQCQSQKDYSLDDSIDSPLKLKPLLSAHDLQSCEIKYIQMDRQGVSFLCELLSIQVQNGNILNQIVMRVESLLAQQTLSRKSLESYRKLLDTFGIQQNSLSGQLLLLEITSFKQNLSLVIQKLKQQELHHQALRNQYRHLMIIRQSEQNKNQGVMLDLQNFDILNQELNETVFRLTAMLCNQKLMIVQAMNLTRQSQHVPLQRLRSDKFVTVKSFTLSSQGDDFVSLKVI